MFFRAGVPCSFFEESICVLFAGSRSAFFLRGRNPGRLVFTGHPRDIFPQRCGTRPRCARDSDSPREYLRENVARKAWPDWFSPGAPDPGVARRSHDVLIVPAYLIPGELYCQPGGPAESTGPNSGIEARGRRREGLVTQSGHVFRARGFPDQVRGLSESRAQRGRVPQHRGRPGRGWPGGKACTSAASIRSHPHWLINPKTTGVPNHRCRQVKAG